MIGTLRHRSTVVHVAAKEPRQAPIIMMAPETTSEGILSLIIPEFILTIRMLLIMKLNHGIRKLVIFVGYVAMSFLSVGKE